MRVCAKLPDVLERVSCGGTRAEAFCTDVHGICAVVYRGDAARQVSGRCKQFNRSTQFY